jgi:energy-coupling factor transporter ATP-binding protein EcfA2
MAKNRTPSQADILRLGPDVAEIKASMPRRRWRKFVKSAHKQGFTVEGQLSGAPKALRERTGASLRRQAEKATYAAYKPVMNELSRREAAAKFLEEKRAADDAMYRQWMSGEVDKLNAQASAADTALRTQQNQIAADLTQAQQAGKADSLARVAGGISDPSQSTALDTSAADAASQQRVAAGREHTATIQKIGDDAAGISRAAMVATAAVREATRTAENWKTLGEIQADRTKALNERSGTTSDIIQQLRDKEITKAQTREELSLAGAELGVKRASITQQAKEASREYGLKKKQFDLDVWEARNRAAAERARIELGYDQIREREGKAAADRALRKWVEQYKAKHGGSSSSDRDAAGVSQDERDIYKTVDTVRTLLVRKLRNGKDERTARKELVDAGFDNVTIDVANDLRRFSGQLSPAGVSKAKRLGIKHVGYFWEKLPNRPHDSQQP